MVPIRHDEEASLCVWRERIVKSQTRSGMLLYSFLNNGSDKDNSLDFGCRICRP